MNELTPLLDIRDLHVHYGSRRRPFPAVRGVSLQVWPGETVGVVGESGSGKTTIARAVLGLARVSAGEIELGGLALSTGVRDRREFARLVQAVFQDPYSSLNPALKIGATLAEPFRAARGAGAEESRRRVAELLERVGLDPAAADRYPSGFSGGQRQRIAIARALMASPRLIICDEAVSALDLSVQAQVLNLLRSLQREFELSYLFISHDLDVVRYMAHRVVVVYRGRVLEHGAADAVAQHPRHPYTQALVAAAPGPRAAARRLRGRSDAATPATGCPFAPRCPHAIARCEAEMPELQPVDRGAVACHRLGELPVLKEPAGPHTTIPPTGEEGTPGCGRIATDSTEERMHQ